MDGQRGFISGTYSKRHFVSRPPRIDAVGFYSQSDGIVLPRYLRASWGILEGSGRIPA
jgi:hypothetical protein